MVTDFNLVRSWTSVNKAVFGLAPFIMRTIVRALLFIAAFLLLAHAQQDAGQPDRKLPDIPGASLSFFPIVDPKNNTDDLSIFSYFSMQNDTHNIDYAAIQRAVIIIHGHDGDPDKYMSYVHGALREASRINPDVNRSSVAIIAPYFANGDPNIPNDRHLYWKGSQWSAGASNRYPRDARRAVSSFDVLDQIVRFFDKKALFPNLKHIVVAGHSLGAQTVLRYAQIGNQLTTASPVVYVIANPNSWTWMDRERPLPIPEDCPQWDNWRAGYERFAAYPMKYGRQLVEREGRQGVLKRWQARSKALLIGLQDFDDALPEDCASHTQGKHHFERALNFMTHSRPWCTSPHGGQCDTVDYVDSNHNAERMLGSEGSLARLFFDNFYGNGSREYDTGPRQLRGDNPYPAPTSFPKST